MRGQETGGAVIRADAVIGTNMVKCFVPIKIYFDLGGGKWNKLKEIKVNCKNSLNGSYSEAKFCSFYLRPLFLLYLKTTCLPVHFFLRRRTSKLQLFCDTVKWPSLYYCLMWHQNCNLNTSPQDLST